MREPRVLKHDTRATEPHGRPVRCGSGGAEGVVDHVPLAERLIIERNIGGRARKCNVRAIGASAVDGLVRDRETGVAVLKDIAHGHADRQVHVEEPLERAAHSCLAPHGSQQPGPLDQLLQKASARAGAALPNPGFMKLQTAIFCNNDLCGASARRCFAVRVEVAVSERKSVAVSRAYKVTATDRAARILCPNLAVHVVVVEDRAVSDLSAAAVRKGTETATVK